ncbi:type VI secretion system baseplate subunit TssG [Orrella daihaiensis]|uniref:Type VI secretion system baseplate subunit TssG n=1 Tax=Orrella daihaiensis TaxID=2782176 RepID=A0ABY4AJE4_9BURK|nr:type VI secretion system baseplate subunit TssG [Orrella daihaiensis]UOD50073.1 type VI secretion system baseplate subunit TssG [Orrella daihaiensis]
MASDARHQAADLTKRLLARGDRYSFFQAYRLLRLLAKREGVAEQDAIRVRPRLGLGFPQTDLQGIEEHGRQRYRVTANFLGLYGVDSPLPTFYTEDLLNEQADGYAVNREFLDVFAQSIYPMFFEAWLKSRPALRVIEYGDTRMLEILYAFVGIEQPHSKFSQPGVGSLLYCGALYNQQTRTAEGLKAVLKASLPNAQVEVRQLQVAWVAIAPEQRFSLGREACTLGDNAHLGARCRTLDGISIELTNLSIQSYRELLPGGTGHERFRFLVDYYLIEPLPVRVGLRLKAGEAAPARVVGIEWSSLGADTWLVSGLDEESVSTSFELRLREPLALAA